MTDAEILAEFKHVTEQDLEDLRTGETEWQQATDSDCNTWIIRYDHEDDVMVVTYI